MERSIIMTDEEVWQYLEKNLKKEDFDFLVLSYLEGQDWAYYMFTIEKQSLISIGFGSKEDG
tara:strand:- start:2522 stop:2707 length:186 start_codon:yes stop_codon:yes gene_type:complete